MMKASKTTSIILGVIAVLLIVFTFSFFRKGDQVSTGTDEVPTEVIVTNDEGVAPPATAPTPNAPKVTPPAAKPATGVASNCVPYLSAKKSDAPKAILLNWTTCSSSEFQYYRVYRSGGLLYTTANNDVANYVDKSTAPATQYDYKVCAVQRLGKTACSNIVKIGF